MPNFFCSVLSPSDQEIALVPATSRSPRRSHSLFAHAAQPPCRSEIAVAQLLGLTASLPHFLTSSPAKHLIALSCVRSPAVLFRLRHCDSVHEHNTDLWPIYRNNYESIIVPLDHQYAD